MAGDQLDLLARHLVGGGDGLLRIAGIVLDGGDDLAAHDAAAGIEVGDGHHEPALHLLAECRVLARDRTDCRDGDVAATGFLARLEHEPSRDGDDHDGDDGAQYFAIHFASSSHPRF